MPVPRLRFGLVRRLAEKAISASMTDARPTVN